MCPTCELTFSQNFFIYLKEASIHCWLIIYSHGNKCIKFYTSNIILMHESSVKIWPLALRKDVTDDCSRGITYVYDDMLGYSYICIQ